VIKSHVITALQVTDVDADADAVSGTSEAPVGATVEVHVNPDDGGFSMRHTEVTGDGTWQVDFSQTVVDNGDGWGAIHDLGPGSRGNANEADDDDDRTFVGWRISNPQLEVAAAPSNWVSGWEWPPDEELTISIDGNGDYTTTARTNESGDFHLGLNHDRFLLAAGYTVTVSDGQTSGRTP
jgi:hypothetical protein